MNSPAPGKVRAGHIWEAAPAGSSADVNGRRRARPSGRAGPSRRPPHLLGGGVRVGHRERHVPRDALRLLEERGQRGDRRVPEVRDRVAAAS